MTKSLIINPRLYTITPFARTLVTAFHALRKAPRWGRLYFLPLYKKKDT